MRINKFIAQATGLSRRAVDTAIEQGRVSLNGQDVLPGQQTGPGDHVMLDGHEVKLKTVQTILLYKPIGYVVSRDGQGSKTVYELLPHELHNLKPVGRLDKDSSGLLILTNDGNLAHALTHPSFQKEKTYTVVIDKALSKPDRLKIEAGVELDDGTSALKLAGSGKNWTVRMSEGRNRQIRRTFSALGYSVTRLHRTGFGLYNLNDLTEGNYLII